MGKSYCVPMMIRNHSVNIRVISRFLLIFERNYDSTFKCYPIHNEMQLSSYCMALQSCNGLLSPVRAPLLMDVHPGHLPVYS